MTGSQLATLIHDEAGTNSTTFTSADMLLYANTMKDELAARIQQVRPEIWNLPVVADLEANQREYTLPADILNSIVSLELDLDDDEYVKAIPLKKNPDDLALTEEAITASYTNQNPYYFIRRQAIYILSGTITAVTDGFKLVSNVFPANLANLTGSDDLSLDPSTTSHGFPREFHELWARRVAIKYKNIHQKPLSGEQLTYKQDLEEALEAFSHNDLSLQEIANVPSSASLGEHGYQY